MFENKYPLFNSGRLLKIDMLKELRDFPREFFDIRLEKYSNGIISGCDIDVTDKNVVIKKGIIKYEDVLYLLKEEKKIEYECNNEMMILKVKFLPKGKDYDFINYSTQIYLDNNLELKDNEIEVCRFKLRTGANLRINHVDFNDLSTEYDTVNIINVPYAAYGESSLNPYILREFGRELLKCNLTEVWDIAFGMTCVQSKDPVQKEIIISYLVNKLNIEMKNYNNKELYYYLLDVLKSAKEGNSGHGRRSGGKFKKIIID